MPISEVGNVFNNFKTAQVKPAQKTIVQNVQEDKFEVTTTSNNTTTKKKAIIAIVTGVALLLAYFNRKAIMKLFKRTEQPEIKPQQPKNEPQAPKTKSQTSTETQAPTIKEEPKIQVTDRYSYYDEYEKADEALLKSDIKTRSLGRAMTAEELAEKRQIRATRKAVLDKIREENNSLIKLRDDIKTKEERIEYIEQYVFDRMNFSEASALDGLDAFEKYGYRRPFRKETSDHTLSHLITKLNTLPKGHKTDKVLNRFLDIFEKTAKKDSKRYEDNEQLGYVINDFIEYSADIKKESVIRAIKLMKKIADQKADYQRINTAMDRYAKKLYEDADIQKELKELKEIVKDCPYVTRKSEQEWESMELIEL